MSPTQGRSAGTLRVGTGLGFAARGTYSRGLVQISETISDGPASLVESAAAMGYAHQGSIYCRSAVSTPPAMFRRREFGQIGTRRTIRWPANSSTDAHLVPSPNPGSLTFFLSQRNIISDPMPTNAAPEALQHWSSSLSMRLFSTPTRIVSTWVAKSQADTSLRWR
jgi:hypothetical protein